MLIESYEDRGYTVEIHTDEDPLNPRKEWDNVGVMCCQHNGRYNLGDGGMDQLYDSLTEDLRWDEMYLNLPEDEEMPEPDDYHGMIELAEKWGYTVLPLYLYDHSGITMSCAPFSCPWDSGQVGIIFMTPQAQHENKIEDPVACLKGEVEVYDMYLTGQVYGYIVKDDEGEELDSCWGFFGDDDYMKEEVKGVVDWHVKENGEQLALI